MNIPLDVINILKKLDDSGYDAFIVGGCVRDSIMLAEPHDWDIATSATPDDVKRIFPHTYDTGVKHGTVTVLKNKKSYEITTFRVDGEYRDFRRPESVSFTGSIVEDLSRRDFTINAIAYRPPEYIDPYGGVQDIENKIIRGVGDPNVRFNEDALRMLRAVRFSARLSFDIEENTYSAIVRNAHLISFISRERIRDELTKLLLSPHPEKLSVLINTGLMRHIFPELTGYFEQNLPTILSRLSICVPLVPMVFSVLFLELSAEQTARHMTELRFDNKTIRETYIIVKWSGVPIRDDFYEIRKMMHLCGAHYFERIMLMKRIIAAAKGEDEGLLNNIEEKFGIITAENHCLSLSDLAVKGGDLLVSGIKPGREMGTVLNELLDRVLRKPSLNTKDTLLEMACEVHAHIS